MTKIVVDLMTGRDDRYIATLRIEPALNMITGYYGDRPVVSVGALCKEIENRRPTLRGRDYKVLPCNDNYILHYDN